MIILLREKFPFHSTLLVLLASAYISTFLSSTARWLHIVGLQYRSICHLATAHFTDPGLVQDGCGTEPPHVADSVSYKEKPSCDRYVKEWFTLMLYLTASEPPKFDLESYVQNYQGITNLTEIPLPSELRCSLIQSRTNQARTTPSYWSVIYLSRRRGSESCS